ncbi:hypothetical protein vseg_021597 [Gypsophila vaccaria]
MALGAILRNSSSKSSPIFRTQTSIIRSFASSSSKQSVDVFDQSSSNDLGSQKTALFSNAGSIPKQNSAASVLNFVRDMSTTAAHSHIGRETGRSRAFGFANSALSSMVGQDLHRRSIAFSIANNSQSGPRAGVYAGGYRGYSSGGGYTPGVVPNSGLKTVLSFATAPITHVYDGIKEIVADYVHHEITRNLLLVCLRLFLIILAKDCILLLF